MTAGQTSFPIAQSIFKFAQHGQSGAWLSELLPHTAKVADDLCFIKSMHTEQINHDPAVTFAQTGSQLAGRPSLGAWVSYGLGTINQDLPAFVVMITGNGQSLAERQWGTGFCRAGIRESSCARWATRCCISRTRRASINRSGHGSSTISGN